MVFKHSFWFSVWGSFPCYVLHFGARIACHLLHLGIQNLSFACFCCCILERKSLICIIFCNILELKSHTCTVFATSLFSPIFPWFSAMSGRFSIGFWWFSMIWCIWCCVLSNHDLLFPNYLPAKFTHCCNSRRFTWRPHSTSVLKFVFKHKKGTS